MGAVSILLGPVGRIGGVILLLAVAGFYLDHRAYRRGFDTAMSAVAAQNARAADVARRAIGDVDTCFDQGGRWNVETGTCDL
ncbi:hypothetical protein [Microbaculum marinum]|uniref:Uncharacterized protein n=1 Tax=Microbaculum marinum TaxID=1764581 RepID=A0AAW9RH10_9HYPH